MRGAIKKNWIKPFQRQKLYLPCLCATTHGCQVQWCPARVERMWRPDCKGMGLFEIAGVFNMTIGRIFARRKKETSKRKKKKKHQKILTSIGTGLKMCEAKDRHVLGKTGSKDLSQACEMVLHPISTSTSYPSHRCRVKLCSFRHGQGHLPSTMEQKTRIKFGD